MRLSPLDRTDLNAEQQEVLEAIEKGPRGANNPGIGMIGPFGWWVRAPKVGYSIQALGEAIRFGGSLPENIKEVAICAVGAYYRSKFEFAAHRRLAKLAGVNEGLTGTAKRSYENLDKTKLIIRHKGKVDETVPGARSRQIQSLYIENDDGERFKYPLTHLAGARAMVRHVANGGRPHDDFGQHWDIWLSERYIDWAVPMNYASGIKNFSSSI